MLKPKLSGIIPHKLSVLLPHIVSGIIIVCVSASSVLFYQQLVKLQAELRISRSQEGKTRTQLTDIQKDYTDLKNQDQIVINKKLKEEIDNIQKTYKDAVSIYEKLLDLKITAKNVKTDKYDELFSESLKHLSERNYASAESELKQLADGIKQEQDKIAATFVIPDNVPTKNAAPGSGYSRQQVQSDVGTFLVDIISADLSSTRVIVDTASDGDCRDNCPVLSLGDYVSRNGAYAGINGSYFCPATYPSCVGKTNSFDLLVMNKNKKYFNSDNNVYSTNPAVIFGGGWVRFVGRALEWGRDTGVDGVLSNFPLVLSGGNIAFGGNDDPKMGSKGTRTFVGSKGNTVYIGVVHNATVAEGAHVLKTLGLENAINLDSGGSTALWSGGYKVGPGRNIPNAILFIRK